MRGAIQTECKEIHPPQRPIVSPGSLSFVKDNRYAGAHAVLHGYDRCERDRAAGLCGAADTWNDEVLTTPSLVTES
jgi:hypothetical protein